MKTNQEFIESYLVGLNHEFARELLWNEYPTDMQGSYFRQFWDVSVVPNRDDTGREGVRRESQGHLQAARVGPRVGRSARTTSATRRGTSRRSCWSSAAICSSGIRTRSSTRSRRPGRTTRSRKNRLVLSDETGELYANDPKDPRLRFPLYRAFVAPDIYFIGFDLTLAEVKGDPSARRNGGGARQARSRISSGGSSCCRKWSASRASAST